MKNIIRNMLPLGLYQRFARLYYYVAALREGPSFVLKLAFSRGVVTHLFSALTHPFSFPVNEENRKVVLGNFIMRELLAGPLPTEAKFIVDAGGYIGDSGALFLSRYPQAHCLVLEPGRAHVWAEKNLAAYGTRAILRKAALMATPGSFQIHEADTGSHVVAATDGKLEVITMQQVMALSPSGRIDILKIDIEGAEVELFRGSCDWLRAVDCISIELHGETAKAEIPVTLIAAGFRLSQHGSLIVALRQEG
jgi:FkbM family methyltransferase